MKICAVHVEATIKNMTVESVNNMRGLNLRLYR